MTNCKSILCVLGVALACAVADTAADTPKLTFTFTKANVPGAMQTGPSGINNAGVMVGGYVDKNSVSHGYILNGKKLTTLDDPKAMAGTTVPENLNPNGAISVVGVYNNSSGNTVGFLYKNGKYTRRVLTGFRDKRQGSDRRRLCGQQWEDPRIPLEREEIHNSGRARSLWHYCCIWHQQCRLDRVVVR
jgi:hypothetical protein